MSYRGYHRKPSSSFRDLAVWDIIAGKWWIVLGCLVAVGGLAVAAGFISKIPLPEAAPGAQSSKVYDAGGRVIGSFHGEENRTIVELSAISNVLKDAVVAAEDRSFYTHKGVSLKGIFRAAITNFRQGEIGQGASTITQQYARTFQGIGKERTYLRKIKEATLAMKIERQYSKQKILTNYLNTVYFGRGAYGAEAAAQTYFKKPARDLDLAEAAYLAGIIRSPSRYTTPQAVASIKTQVLGSMLDAGYIDQARMDQAKLVDLTTRFRFGESAEQDSPKAGYFIEYVRQLLLHELKIPEKDLLGGGLKIYTSLDMTMQEAAEEAVRSTINLPNDPEVALVAMDPQGHVRAMVGGRVVDDSKRARGFNFAANLPGNDGGRQAGSAFKPLALAAFVDEGKSVNSVFTAPSQIQLDSQKCRNEDGTPWKVSNFGNAGYGNLNLVEGTVRSVNTVYAQVMEKVVSPANFMEMAAKAGINIPKVDQGCALTLGTSPVTPLEMARAYATFAARGKRPEPLVVLKVVAPDGTVIHERRPRSEQTIDQNVADTVSWVLKQNVLRGTGTAAKLGYPAMGKTGTAQNHQDASFAGSTPELTAVVWMGYAPVDVTDPKTGIVRKEIPLMENVHGKKVTGGSFPAQIWKKFMSVALKGSKHSDFPTPRLGGEVLAPPPPECPGDEEGIGSGRDGSDGFDSGDAIKPVAFHIDTDGDGVLDALDPACQVEPSPTPTPTPTLDPFYCGLFPCEPDAQPTNDPRLFPTIPRRSPCFPFECPVGSPTPGPTTTTKPPDDPPSDTKPKCFPFCEDDTAPTTLPEPEPIN